MEKGGEILKKDIFKGKIKKEYSSSVESVFWVGNNCGPYCPFI